MEEGSKMGGKIGEEMRGRRSFLEYAALNKM
jgi:hypothetical protein